MIDLHFNEFTIITGILLDFKKFLDDNLYVYTIYSLKFLSRKDEIKSIIYENQKLQQ